MDADPRILTAAATEVDVIDLAGRIIANPRRQATAASAAQVLALAHATETFWAVCVEADVLVRALSIEPVPLTFDAARDLAISKQSARVVELMAAIRGENPNEQKEEN